MTSLRAPGFWTSGGWQAAMLSPLSTIGAAVTARRVARRGWLAPVPVICVGNATVGGAGKTTVALDLAYRLTERNRAVHILSRGYRAASADTRRVLLDDSANAVGDEPLLLAAAAPTWIGADRGVSARAAIHAGAEVLLMDDGLQNPALQKTMSFLVVDGATGFGNGRVLPAGPLREPVATAAARCRAAIIIGPDISGAATVLPPSLPVLRADPRQGPEVDAVRGRRIAAFAGIAIPEKFFGALERAGATEVIRVPFPDHHLFTPSDLWRLDILSREMPLVTTPKDAVRLPPEFRARVLVVSVKLVWDDESGIESLLDEALSRRDIRSDD